MTHPNVSGFEALMAGLYINYEGAWGPRVKYKRAPPKSGRREFGMLHGIRKFKGRR